MVQEYGEIDLARLLAKHDAARRAAAGQASRGCANSTPQELDENFIRLYWQQMLQVGGSAKSTGPRGGGCALSDAAWRRGASGLQHCLTTTHPLSACPPCLPGPPHQPPPSPPPPRTHQPALTLPQAVSGVHEQRIVHSDLKPANFLLVEGQLKLIDFGIAKAISGDTTSIAREAQVNLVCTYTICCMRRASVAYLGCCQDSPQPTLPPIESPPVSHDNHQAHAHTTTHHHQHHRH